MNDGILWDNLHSIISVGWWMYYSDLLPVFFKCLFLIRKLNLYCIQLSMTEQPDIFVFCHIADLIAMSCLMNLFFYLYFQFIAIRCIATPVFNHCIFKPYWCMAFRYGNKENAFHLGWPFYSVPRAWKVQKFEGMRLFLLTILLNV